MAITLEEAKVSMADHVDQAVIDEFERSSYLLQRLTFDNAVSPGTGGSTLVYGYTQLKTPSTASFRALNTEYTKNEAKRVEKTAKLKIFGGAFDIDRVIIETSGAVDELDFQMKQKIEAASNLFHYTVINGDSAKNADEFDGLAKLIKGSSTEQTVKDMDISTSALMTSNAQSFLDTIDSFLALLDGKPDAIMTNSVMLTKMKGIARRAGYYSRTEDAFGRPVDTWDNIPLIDLGKFFNGTKTVDVVGTDAAAGTADIYAVKFGLDAFHAVSPVGNKVIATHLPDLQKPGVLKEGDVEMVAAVVLKNSLKAGVLHGVKIAAGA